MRGTSVALPRLVIAIVFIATGTTSLAQDLDEQEDRPVVQNLFDLDESNFDQWVFGNMIRPNAGRTTSSSSSVARDQLDSLLKVRIAEIERTCSLSDSQKKKLLLAGHGDVKHFMDRVAEARKVYEQLRHDPNSINTIRQETVPLAASLNTGLFGTDSFFFKTVGTTLEPEQAARFRKAILDKNLFRHQAKVRLAITNLDNAVGFTAEQRQRLTALALDQTKPTKNSAGQFELQVVLLKLARLPEDKVRPIFDAKSWQLLNQKFQQARGMEAFLEARGFLEESDLDTTAKPIETKHEHD